MPKYENIFFDLDGTLSDSGVGIGKAVVYALAKYGIVETDKKNLDRFVGPPLYDSFMNYYGFSREQSVEAVEFFREYYVDTGLFENYPYDGIDLVLKELSTSGKKLFVATSKPETLAKRVLKYFGLSDFFTDIVGATDDGSVIKKDDVLALAVSRNNITDLRSCIMVGDRASDVFGARKVGMATMGVLYGYGDKAEIEGAKPDFIAKTVSDIGEILK